ncbi:hypothetical protein K461DRAFT_265997 [Myriangium duriaei CBS 260.36]|uniref:Uncharacterized protein n=1 Tax=Myriangium duriaei CBS 260.36 TaxID=1168546 RepID=A0A9P4MLW1_9PEZI|nr:hypothetical protein K461DRAFT_265997 [Myriangium duriaei CBS 260.36]
MAKITSTIKSLYEICVATIADLAAEGASTPELEAQYREAAGQAASKFIGFSPTIPGDQISRRAAQELSALEILFQQILRDAALVDDEVLLLQMLNTIDALVPRTKDEDNKEEDKHRYLYADPETAGLEAVCVLFFHESRCVRKIISAIRCAVKLIGSASTLSFEVQEGSSCAGNEKEVQERDNMGSHTEATSFTRNADATPRKDWYACFQGKTPASHESGVSARAASAVPPGQLDRDRAQAICKA